MLQKSFADHVISLHVVEPFSECQFISISCLTQLSCLRIAVTKVSSEAQSEAAVALASLQSLSRVDLSSVKADSSLARWNLGPLTGLSSLSIHAFSGSIAVAGTVANLRRLSISAAKDTPSESALQALSALTQLQSFTSHQSAPYSEVLQAICHLPSLRELSCTDCTGFGRTLCTALAQMTRLQHLTLKCR